MEESCALTQSRLGIAALGPSNLNLWLPFCIYFPPSKLKKNNNFINKNLNFAYMHNLREWIEAQLKRGYSRKQIKNALVRKGYSPKAVAKVDKIRYSAELQSKKIPKISYKAFIGIIIVIGVLSHVS